VAPPEAGVGAEMLEALHPPVVLAAPVHTVPRSTQQAAEVLVQPALPALHTVGPAALVQPLPSSRLPSRMRFSTI
jgi:hypothetical protein